MYKFLLITILLISNVFASGTRILPVDSFISADTTKAFALPSASDTLVGRSSTDNLTNKTYNKISLTAPATGSTFTLLDGLTFTVNKSLTLDGTNGTTMTFPATSATVARTDAAQTFTGAQTFSSTIVGSINGNAATVTNGVYTTNKLSALSATTSAELAGVISDETGTNKLVYSDSPTLVTPALGAASATSLSLGTALPATSGGTGLATVGTETKVLKVVSGALAYAEEDRSNLLLNPAFEDSTNTSWTCTTGTCTSTNTSGEFSSGLRAMKIVPASNVVSVSQSQNTPAGIIKQGVVGIDYRVPATCATTFSVCSLVDTAEQTCVPSAKLIADDVYHTIEIPLVFGATSAGIKIKATSSCTGNIFIDRSYLKAGIGTQALQGDTWYAAAIASNGTSISNQNVAGWAASSSFSSTGVLDVVPASGKFTVVPNCQITADDTSSTSLTEVKYDKANSTASLLRFHTNLAAIATNAAVIIHCDKQGNDYLAASSAVYSQASADTTRAGKITPIAGATCGAGNLLADGAAISRTTYSELFAEIGTTYGVGDGSTTFNLPNLKGVFLRGAGSQSIGGITYSGTLAASQSDLMQGHNHAFYGSNAGGGTSLYSQFAGDRSTTTLMTGGASQQVRAASDDGTNGSPRVGSETRPANVSVNYCISTKGINSIVGSFAGYSTSYSFSANTSTTAGTTTQPFIFTVKDHDTTGSLYSTSTGKFTAPVAGKWSFGSSVYSTAGYSSQLFKNGVAIYIGSVGSTSTYSLTNYTLSLAAGDTIDVRPSNNATLSNGGVAPTFYGFKVAD